MHRCGGCKGLSLQQLGLAMATTKMTQLTGGCTEEAGKAMKQ